MWISAEILEDVSSRYNTIHKNFILKKIESVISPQDLWLSEQRAGTMKLWGGDRDVDLRTLT